MFLQIEKAFREGTARQNAYSIFVCLALKLLEDRVHVACKEIITLEKQVLSSVIFDLVETIYIHCLFPEHGLIITFPFNFVTDETT